MRSPGRSGYILCLGSHKVQNQGMASLSFHWKFWERICFQAHSCCWENSFPGGCETEALTSLLAVNWASFSTSGGVSQLVDPPIFQTSTNGLNPPHASDLSDLVFPHRSSLQPEKVLCFRRTPVLRLGSPR